jgi:dTDP-4-amino-4,6-dideoxygalactose transaminase
MASRSIPFFNYPALFMQDEAGLTDVVMGVLKRGAYIMQKDLTDFEAALAEFAGVKHAIGVADGTNAMLLGLWALDLPRDSEVIIASHTYVATAGATHFAGLVPVPVDCGPDHMIDPAAIEAAITPKTKVIMPTQVNGRTSNMDAIREIAKKHNLIIAEDAAQALGSKYKGQCAGTFGAFGTISFYPAKLLGCFGDGGAVFTNDDKVAERVRLLRDHGRNDDGEFVTWGTNSRLDNLQAAVLLHRLKTYDKDIARRRQIASLYQEKLGGISDLTLPPAPGSEPDHFDVFQNYEIEAGKRDTLRDHLKAAGIGTLIQWSGQPIHQIKALGLQRDCPATDRLFTRTFMLPMHMALSDEDVDYICDTIRAFYQQNS